MIQASKILGTGMSTIGLIDADRVGAMYGCHKIFQTRGFSSTRAVLTENEDSKKIISDCNSNIDSLKKDLKREEQEIVSHVKTKQYFESEIARHDASINKVIAYHEKDTSLAEDRRLEQEVRFLEGRNEPTGAIAKAENYIDQHERTIQQLTDLQLASFNRYKDIKTRIEQQESIKKQEESKLEETSNIQEDGKTKLNQDSDDYNDSSGNDSNNKPYKGDSDEGGRSGLNVESINDNTSNRSDSNYINQNIGSNVSSDKEESPIAFKFLNLPRLINDFIKSFFEMPYDLDKNNDNSIDYCDNLDKGGSVSGKPGTGKKGSGSLIDDFADPSLEMPDYFGTGDD